MPSLRLYESGHSVAGGNTLDLASRLPSAAVRAASELAPMAEWVIRNTGTAAAYVRTAAGSTPTAMEIPAGETRELGPLEAGGNPDITLDCPASADCLVDTFYQGATS